MSAGRFLRDRRRRAAPAASGLALSSRRPGPARAGVSGSRPRGGVTWRAGDRGRGELGALLSPPRGGGARPAQASLSTPRPPARPPARPLTGRAGGASAPHPLPGRWGAGRGRGGRGLRSFPSGPQPRAAAAAPAPPLLYTPSRPCLPAGDLGRRRRRTDRAGRQLSVRSPAGREGGEGRGGEERGRALSPAGRGEPGREAKKEGPPPFPARVRRCTG